MSTITDSINAMNYDSLDREIKRVMKRSARDVVQLGFMLRRMLEDKVYLAMYDDFDSYLAEELHMDYTAATRFIKINKKYSWQGHSMEVAEEYEDYSQSLLIEMLNMPKELEAKVTPDMTVSQVREIKRQAKQKENKTEPVAPEKKEVIIDGEYREIEEVKKVATSQPDEEAGIHNEAWFVKQYAEIMKREAQELFQIGSRESNNADRAKAIQKCIAPYGCHAISSLPEYSFDFHGFAGGMDFQIGTEKMHIKYGRFAQELMTIFAEKENTDAVLHDDNNEQISKKCITGWSKYGVCSCCGTGGAQCCSQCSKSCNSRCGWIEEPYESEEVLVEDTEEILKDDIAATKYILEEQKKLLNDYLEVGGLPEMTVFKQKTIVAALASMVAELEMSMPIPEQEEPEQPEIPVLKNNDQRGAFIDSYKDWPVWIDTQETGERYYRYDFQNGTSFVVKAYFHKCFDYKSTSAKKWEDRFRDEWGAEEYYILTEGKYFKDCLTNRSIMVDFLKNLQKKG